DGAQDSVDQLRKCPTLPLCSETTALDFPGELSLMRSLLGRRRARFATATRLIQGKAQVAARSRCRSAASKLEVRYHALRSPVSASRYAECGYTQVPMRLGPSF